MSAVSAGYHTNSIVKGHSGNERRIYADDEVRQAFQAFDLDKNNYIGISELKHVLTLIGERVTDEEVDEMIRLADTDGSGQVSFDGFYRLFGSKPTKTSIDMTQGSVDYFNRAEESTPLESDVSPRAAQEMNIVEVLNELTNSIQITPVYIRTIYKQFQKYDTEKTGRVNYPDFLKVMQSEDHPLFRRLFDLLDTQLSGEIDEKVFLICLLMHAPNKIRLTERIKISFSLLRASGKTETCIRPANLVKLLNVFFMCREDEFGGVDAATRADTLIRSTNSARTASGTLPDDVTMTFEQFSEVLSNNPELVLPSVLVSEIVLETQ